MANPKYSDLPDSEKDKQKMKQEEVILNLPDVKDIPGQENINVPDLKEMADTTISSDDEEGVGLFDDENDKDVSSERLGAAGETDENDLIIDEQDAAAILDTEEEKDADDDADLEVTDDIVSEESEVTPDEIKALERTEDMDTQDNENLFRAELDDTDFDGEKLNEDEDVSGKDLDVPGADEDDADEEIGEEDEENNEYSLGDNK